MDDAEEVTPTDRPSRRSTRSYEWGRPVKHDLLAELLLIGFAVGLIVLFFMIGFALGGFR